MSNSGKNMGRRQFLKGSSATLMLPLLESLMGGRAYAQAASAKRFVTLYMPNGTAMYLNKGLNWYIGTGGPLVAANLPPIFQPFSSQINDVSLLRGILNREPGNTPFGGQHSQGMSGFLTAAPATSDLVTCTITGDSLDQIVAGTLGNLKPLVLAGGGSADARADATQYPYGELISYKNKVGVEPIRNPFLLAGNLMKGITGGGGVQTQVAALARNRSILDSMVGGAASLQKRLSASDKAKLDDYLTSVRQLEVSLKAAPRAPLAGCTAAPAVPANMNNDDYYCNSLDFPARLKMMMDLIVFAFKCDLHRVVAFTFDAETATRRLRGKIPAALLYQNTQLNDEENHIDVAHHEGTALKNNRCISRDRFYLSYLFYLMSQLKATTDAVGVPLLDNTLILSGFGFADGNHTGYSGNFYGNPMLLAGGRSMIQTGRQLDYATGTDQKDLLYTIATKLGHSLPNFRGSSKLLAI